MTFFEHLEELRQRLRIVIVVVIILFVLNLTTSIGPVSIGSTQVPMLLPALGPTSPNIATQFFLAMKNFLVPARVGPVPLNFSFKEPWDAYVVMFKVAFFLAAVTASPLIVYQVGRFVGPALKPTERRLIIRVTVPVLLLFLSGVALCFVVILPFTFNLLFSVQNLLGANLLILYGASFIDFILIIIAVLLLFGPSKLPELARGVGRALGEFRRGKMQIEREISTELSALDTRDLRMRVEKAAGALGLSASGRSEMELKLDIARAVDRARDDQVVSAAEAMGVYSSGADVIRLKEQIIKALNV